MCGRTVKIEWRACDDAATLKSQYLQERDALVKARLHLLWLVRQGELVQAAAAAAVVGVHVRTARQRVAWYREGGLEMVRAKKRPHGLGRACRLSPEQQQGPGRRSVGAWLCHRSGSGGLGEAAVRLGVEYAAGSMGNLLARKGIAKKVPRSMKVKAGDAVQAAYKKGD